MNSPQFGYTPPSADFGRDEMADKSNECTKCGDQLESDKFSDAVNLGPFYFDVHITACPGCGYVHDDKTWVE